MAKITKKGLVNSLISTTSILICVLLFCMLYIKDFFYSNVIHFVSSQFSTIDTLSLQSNYKTLEEYKNVLAEFVCNFPESKKMELILLDDKNKVVATSSGFEITYKYEDVNEIKTESHDVISIGRLGKQKVMVFEHNLPNMNKFKTKIMVLVDKVDAEFNSIVLMFLMIMIAALIFMIVSNTYFTNTVASTIWSITETTNKIAKGNFKTKVAKRSNDELGDLCDAINDMAKELDANEKIKNEFISSISHELRTPLTAIKGWAETLKSTPFNEDIVEKGFRIIISESERLSNMVEELLDFSRLQKMSSALKKERLNLVKIVEDVVLIFCERAKREGKLLTFNSFEKDVLVLIDLNRIKQVIINVIDNALKYSELGDSVKVSMLLRHVKGGKYTVIKVEDSGCGIKKEDLSKIKTKFFKANYTKRGSGIGLAVADEIIKLHGGLLEVSSIESKGTTVEIMLPFPAVRTKNKQNL